MLLLARHGRTAYNAEGRFQGQAAVPLDATGRAQASALAERLADRGDVGRMVSSPLSRALETAAILAARLGLAPDVDERLAETDVGAWTHRTYAEVAAEAPAAYAAFRALEPGFGAPSGETFAAQLARCRAAVADLRAADAPAGPVTLVVCHGNVMRLLLRDRDGTAPEHGDLDNTDVLPL